MFVGGKINFNGHRNTECFSPSAYYSLKFYTFPNLKIAIYFCEKKRFYSKKEEKNVFKKKTV